MPDKIGTSHSHGRKAAAPAKNMRQIRAAVPATRKLITAQRGQISRNRPTATRRESRRRMGRTEAGKSVIYALVS
jgi:hypothetical protein